MRHGPAVGLENLERDHEPPALHGPLHRLIEAASDGCHCRVEIGGGDAPREVELAGYLVAHGHCFEAVAEELLHSHFLTRIAGAELPDQGHVPDSGSPHGAGDLLNLPVSNGRNLAAPMVHGAAHRVKVFPDGEARGVHSGAAGDDDSHRLEPALDDGVGSEGCAHHHPLNEPWIDPCSRLQQREKYALQEIVLPGEDLGLASKLLPVKDNRVCMGATHIEPKHHSEVTP